MLFQWNGDLSDRTERDVEDYPETDFYDLPIHSINSKLNICIRFKQYI